MEAPTNHNNAVVIVAAGRGERAGQKDGPKQYRKIHGKTVLTRTLEAFTGHDDIDLVLVVIHADDRALYDAASIHSSKLLPPAIGGATRQASVLEGLRALAKHHPKKVLIHDAARPFVAASIVTDVLAAIDGNKGALPVLPLTDTIKQGNGALVEKTISRHNLYAAQTPQGFAYTGILEAHEEAALQSPDQFTDDASIAEWAGIPVTMVQGHSDNKKLTIAEDFIMTDLPDVRTGNGYDVHAFEEGNSVRLCGVDIAHTARLKGHSDADVGLHALTDALLGTMGDGDIGSHFPPSDEKWKNANSEVFFRHAVDLVKKRGGTITHLDVTLICEAPKIGPHREAMRKEMARMAEIGVERVSAKATTNEGIGFIGRREGIAAIATATVVFPSGN